MPFRHADRPDHSYYLISVDKNGVERRDDPDAPHGELSTVVSDQLRNEPYTDVFLLSHGWKGAVPDAVEQCDKWIGAMASATGDVEAIRRERPGFNPLLVGFHWPSLSFGDESFAGVAFATPDGDGGIDQMIEEYAGYLADTPAARAALRTIIESAGDDVSPASLPAEVVTAYQTLDRESGLGAARPGGTPADDREPFDPEAAYQATVEDADVSFANPVTGAVIGLLQVLSFWKMKDRARLVGEVGVHGLLAKFQAAAAGRDVRFHLMGHSFGCIVQSAATAGPVGRYGLRQPVDSLTLLQGALSFWSYCSDIPHARGKAGYFRSIVADKRVSGAIVTSQSEHDTAVGRLYPLAAGARRDVVFDETELPKYGALGTFGVRGPGCDTTDLDMHDTATAYGLERGKIYNINSDRYISHKVGASGAHSDIANKEVAHAMWAAVRL